MAAPRTPADFKSLISDPGASLCGNFVNTLLKLPLYLYELVSWLLDSDGNLSTEVQKSITALTLKPGDVIESFGLLNTDGRLLCDGAAYSRTDYADLFAAIGTTYGAGNGTTTFNVPDCRDRFPVGVSGTKVVGSTGGEDTHVLTTAEMPSHTHGARLALDTSGGSGATVKGWAFNSSIGIGGGSNNVADRAAGDTTGFSTANANAGYPIAVNGSGTAHNNIPPYMARWVYIKT